MSPSVRNVLLGLVFAAFVVSNLVLIRSNARLRNELDVASRTIAKLQQNLFHGNVTVNDSPAPAEIVLYNHLQPARTPSSNSDQPNSFKPLSPDYTPGMSLLDLKSKYLDKAAQSGFSLFVFFSPTDCPACLLEAAIWQKLHADSQRLNLQVIGIMNHPDKTEGEQFLKQLGVTFPVLFDNTAFLKTKYKIGETPEKVIIDSQGKILLISPGSKTEEEKREFEESALKLMTGKSS